MWPIEGLSRNRSGRRFSFRADGSLLRVWGPGSGLGWCPAGGVDLQQAGDGVLEGPFTAGAWQAAHREAAEAEVVLGVAGGPFGDRAAAPVGGDALRGSQPGRPSPRVARRRLRGARGGLVWRAARSMSRCLPVVISRSGPSMVRLCSEQYPASARAVPNLGAPPVQRPPRMGAQQILGGLGFADHRLEAGVVGGVLVSPVARHSPSALCMAWAL